MPTPKEIVIEFNHEVIEKGNQDTERFFDPAFINHSASAEMDNGATGMFRFFNNILRPALSGLQVEILQQACEEEVVFTHKRFTGQHTGALFGIEPTQKFVYFEVMDRVRVRDGRYYEHWGVNTFTDLIQKLAQ